MDPKAAAKHEMDSKALNDRGGAVDLLKHQPVNKQLTMVNEEVERESEVSDKRQRAPADTNQNIARKISEA